MSVLERTPHLLGFGVQMTRFCPAERWLRVRMRTRPRGAGSPRKVLACSHANKTSGCRKLEKGARVFACEQDFGEPEAQERCSRVRMRTKLGHLVPLSPEKGVPVFACEQDLGEPEAPERCSRVRMRTKPRVAGSSRKVFACSHANKTSGSWKLEKGGCVFACEQTWGVGSSRKAPACSHANKNLGWLFCLNGIFFSQPPPFLW